MGWNRGTDPELPHLNELILENLLDALPGVLLALFDGLSDRCHGVSDWWRFVLPVSFTPLPSPECRLLLPRSVDGNVNFQETLANEVHLV